MKLIIRPGSQMLLFIFAVFGAAAVGYTGISAFFAFIDGGLTTTVHAQQDPFLSQRLNRIEQRFTLIESRLNQIEQQSRYPATLPNLPGTDETEIRLLHSQIDALRLRVAETECGLIRLDERTLNITARQAQRKSGADKSDVCRQTPNAPIQLSARP